MIIRVEDERSYDVEHYLWTRMILHRVYDYPFPKNGDYGQGRRNDAVTDYLADFLKIFSNNSKLAVKRDPRKDFAIIERITHALINAFGYNWEIEARILDRLSWGRLKVLRKYGNLSGREKLRLVRIVNLLEKANGLMGDL